VAEGTVRFNEVYEAFARMHYDSRQARFVQQTYGIHHTLDNLWVLSYGFNFYEGRRREGSFGFVVEVDAPDSDRAMASGSHAIAFRQAALFQSLWLQVASHVRTDRALPARFERVLRQHRGFGSRDRRLYRELFYTTLRFLPLARSGCGGAHGRRYPAGRLVECQPTRHPADEGSADREMARPSATHIGTGCARTVPRPVEGVRVTLARLVQTGVPD
jgi:hypothetical protein